MTSVFTRHHLDQLVGTVSDSWRAGADRDWSVRAGTLEWSCRQAADHAVDCTVAPAFFLASRKTDSFPDMGQWAFTVGPEATPAQLIQALEVAGRVLAAVVADAPPSTKAVIRRRPTVQSAPAADFLPRGALELILHAHDVCSGLAVPFEPSAELCTALIAHTADWPWGRAAPGWRKPVPTSDPWGELLSASGRSRYVSHY